LKAKKQLFQNYKDLLNPINISSKIQIVGLHLDGMFITSKSDFADVHPEEDTDVIDHIIIATIIVIHLWELLVEAEKCLIMLQTLPGYQLI
jgi:hypothetical protein